MPHDISGINSGRSQQSSDKQVQSLRRDQANSTARSQNQSAQQNDKVSLTDMASRLKALEQKLVEQPSVDQARVDRLRQSLARGEYQVDPERVADKIIDFEADL